ncbi:MAG: LCP family protein, partial [Clostridiales Family XIII bacterium]|nr:LCP family protein [Clostridiales Family XIII bacterium]
NILLGIPINYYAIIDYQGIKNIVDSLGGVPMDVPFDMSYHTEGVSIEIAAGQQVLDGEHAVQFIRYRSGYSNGDIGRVEAQQNFVKSAAKQALGLNLPKVAKTVVANVNSDITNRAIVYLGAKAVGMDSANINAVMLPGYAGNIGGLSFWIRDEDYTIEEILRTVYNGPPEVSTDPLVEEDEE